MNVQHHGSLGDWKHNSFVLERIVDAVDGMEDPQWGLQDKIDTLLSVRRTKLFHDVASRPFLKSWQQKLDPPSGQRGVNHDHLKGLAKSAWWLAERNAFLDDILSRQETLKTSDVFMLRYASGLKKRPEHLVLPRFTVGILLELSKWNTLKKLEILDWDLRGSGALIGEQPMLDDQSLMAIVFYSCRLEHLRIPNIEWHNAFDDCVSQSLQFLECPAASFLPSRRSGRQQACSLLFPNLKHLVLSFDSEGYFNGVQDRLSDALKGSALDDLTLIFSGENINGSDDVTLAFFQKGCVKRLVVQDLSDKQFAGMMQHGIGSFEELVFSSRGPGPAQVWSCDDPNGGVWQFRNFEPASCAAEGSSCGTIAKPDDPGQRASA